MIHKKLFILTFICTLITTSPASSDDTDKDASQNEDNDRTPHATASDTPRFFIDKNQKLVATLHTDNPSIISLVNGQPVAFIHSPHVYGINGKHLGWLKEGLIFNHQGFITCVLSHINPKPSLTPIQPQYIPQHAPKKQHPSLPPTLSYTFAQEHCSLFLAQGYLTH